MHRLPIGNALRIAPIVLVSLSVFLLHYSASPQPSIGGNESQAIQIGWDGRAITRTCHAAVDDLPAFKSTLIEHEKTLIGFIHKIRDGILTYGELSNGRINSAKPRVLLEKITENIKSLDNSGKTAALVYDMGLFNEHYSLCVWLITAQGIEAAETVPVVPGGPFGSLSVAALLRRVLHVELRAARRAPARCALVLDPWYQNSQNSEDESEPYIREMEDAQQLLLPLSVAAKLQASDAKRLLILPVADIGSIPFPALPFGGRQLIDRFALVLLPDLNALLGVSRPPRPWRSEPQSSLVLRSLVVGDPDLPQEQFPPLPGARSEAIEVAEMTGVKPLLGPEATKTEVLGRMQSGPLLNLIYLATHGCSDPVNPMDGSFLGLTGDHLYGRDIKELEFLNNPLVVMSACQTGLGKVFEGGTFGLVRAWYHAGSPQIVMSLWNIDDAATKHIMVQFMRQLEGGVLAEFSLQRALLAERAINSDPALWAGIALFGLPSSF